MVHVPGSSRDDTQHSMLVCLYVHIRHVVAVMTFITCTPAPRASARVGLAKQEEEYSPLCVPTMQASRHSTLLV